MQAKGIECDIHQQPIISLCLESKCQKPKLCCFLCTQEHFQHFPQMVSIQEFKRFTQDLNDQQIQAQYQINSPLNHLNKLKDLTKHFLDIITQETEKYQNILIQELINKKNQPPETNKELLDLIKLIKPFSIIKDNNMILADIVETKKYPSLTSVICRLSDLIRFFNQLKEEGFVQQQKMIFSYKHKHPSYQINLQSPNIITKNGSQYGVAYGNPEFDLKSDNFQFSFEILTKPNNIWIGIGSLIEDYIFDNFQETGHYQYLISQHTFVFHHSDSNYNNVQRGFSFSQNDIVNIQYDALTKTLRFQKQKCSSYFKMPIKVIDKLVRPVIWMQDGDSVRLLEL